jgi:hypothetical protein
VIEAIGSTSLVAIGDNFYLNSGSGPELKYVFRRGRGCRPVRGAWTPVGAEPTAGGYVVAWKNPGADQYTSWNTDSSGNFVSDTIGIVSGASPALGSLEATVHQDLNGDGVISASAQTVQSGIVNTSSTSADELFSGNTGSDSFVFAADMGNGTITNNSTRSGHIQFDHAAAAFTTEPGPGDTHIAADDALMLHGATVETLQHHLNDFLVV